MPPLTSGFPRAPIYRRPAAAADRDFLFATRRDGFASYIEWDDDVQRALADREFAELPYEIVEEHGVAIGYRCVEVRDDHVWLDELAVVPSARWRGIGSRLIREVMDHATMRGLPVRLSALTRNQAAFELYERLGFWITHVEPPRVHLEWFPPVVPRVLDQPREEAELSTAIEAGDHVGVANALYHLLRAVSDDGTYTPDGCVEVQIEATSPTTIEVRGQVAEIVTQSYAYDPFCATIERADDGASVTALTLRWGDAATGLGAGRSDGTQMHPAERVREWLYVFHKSRIIAK